MSLSAVIVPVFISEFIILHKRDMSHWPVHCAGQVARYKVELPAKEDTCVSHLRRLFFSNNNSYITSNSRVPALISFKRDLNCAGHPAPKSILIIMPGSIMILLQHNL